MEELMTIKDIFDEQTLSEYGLTGIRDDLKQEGIKHYHKYFNQALNADKQKDIETKNFCMGHCAMIKEFLNLTEEDLK